MSLLYVYALARTDRERPWGLQELTGIGGAVVEPVPLGPGVAAVVSRVPEEEFAEPALRRSLEDLHWVEQVARAHDGVVRRLAPHFPLLPLRLAVLHRDAVALRASAAPRICELTARLDAVAGAAEWGVAVDLVPLAEVAADPQPPPADGRAYLRRRREEQQRADEREAAAGELCRVLTDELASLARESRRLRPQPVELARAVGRTPTAAVNVANHAYLVADDRAERFRERVAALGATAPPGVRVRVTGPWAPYSFAGS